MLAILFWSLVGASMAHAAMTFTAEKKAKLKEEYSEFWLAIAIASAPVGLVKAIYPIVEDNCKAIVKILKSKGDA